MRVRRKTRYRFATTFCVAVCVLCVVASLYVRIEASPAPAPTPDVRTSTLKVVTPKFVVPGMESFSRFESWRLQRPLFDPPPKVEPPPPPKPKIPPPRVQLYSIAMTGGTPARATFTDETGAFLNRRVGESVSDQVTTAVVEDIKNDRVLLRHNGDLVTLTFSKN